MKKSNPPIIPCELHADRRERIIKFADALVTAAPSIGDHGLSEVRFWESGLFENAIERLRGQRSARLKLKKQFVEEVLNHLKSLGAITAWSFTGARDRHDYEVEMKHGYTAIIETRGCLDGNNTNIYERPPQADEFLIWSLCQNAGADPRHNAWSGLHSRLSAEIVHRRQLVEGVVIWDMLCGTEARPCPRLIQEPSRSTSLPSHQTVPPPCLYLLPKSIPDPRNNPSPPSCRLEDLRFLRVLADAFHVRSDEITSMSVEVRIKKATTQRKTRFECGGIELAASGWTDIRRAKR